MGVRYKIAIITRTYPPRGGGIAAAHFNIAQCLSVEHDVKIFAFDDDSDSKEANLVRASTGLWKRKILTWLAQRWVARYAKGLSSINCERIFNTIPAIRKLNKAIMAYEPQFILCPDNYVPALALKKPKNAKLIWVAHNNYRRFEGNPIATNYSWIDLQLAHRLELRAMRKADAVVAVSDYMAAITADTLNPGCLSTVIKNYVDVDYLSAIQPSQLKKKLGVPESTRIIYIPSGGSSIKGERYVFEILRRLAPVNNVAFFISGNINSTLEFELNKMADGAVVYCPGAQNYAENLSDVAACDLTISPTLIENLSSAIIEALILGIPVVSFDVGGNKELINGENGVLVEYLDLEALIAESVTILEDKDRLERMKNTAKDSMMELGDPRRVHDQYTSLFTALEQGNGSV